jgi:K+/H+ antiporter YhaU regulatory subunit KhtT
MLFNPPAEAEIEGGDFLIVMGESGNLQRLEQMLAEVRA